MIMTPGVLVLPAILFTALSASAEDWSAPIQCAVETRIGRGPTQRESLSGMTHGTFTKAVETQIVNQLGTVTKEVFNLDIKVQLTSTDLYTLSITDIDRNTTWSNEASVPSGGSGSGNLMFTQNYSTSGGVGVSYPRFTVSLKCDLRSQVAAGPPDVTPGPPR